MQVLLAFLPSEFIPVLIVVIGLGIMVGLVRFRAAAGVIGGIILLLLLSPFVETFVASLPWWLSLLILAGIGWVLIRGLLRLVLGAGAADEMIGSLAAAAVLGGFRGLFFLLFLPFRLVGWFFRRI